MERGWAEGWEPVREGWGVRWRVQLAGRIGMGWEKPREWLLGCYQPHEYWGKSTLPERLLSQIQDPQPGTPTDALHLNWRRRFPVRRGRWLHWFGWMEAGRAWVGGGWCYGSAPVPAATAYSR